MRLYILVTMIMTESLMEFF